MSSWREVYKYQDRKAAAWHALTVIPKKISAEVSQDNKRKMWG
jgi:hypothetical protein